MDSMKVRLDILATLSAACVELRARSAQAREQSREARKNARRAIERAEKILTSRACNGV
jgi:hypothetical protein